MSDNAPNDVSTAAALSLSQQLGMMRAALDGSALRRKIMGFGLAAIAIIVATSLGQIILNRWNAPFYDAIERKDVAALLHQLQLFALIAGGLLTLGVGQTWLNQRFRLRLREALTLDLITEWMKPRRAFRLANAGAIGVNPDQRMQEDAGHLADLTTGLSFGFVQSSILLVSFVGILWSLSSGFVFHWDGASYSIPGYMVWAAFIYAGSASAVSWLVGRPLVGLNSERYSREADLRFSMMRVNEHIDAITIAGGEQDERRRMSDDLGVLLASIQRIFRVQIRLEWVTDGYGWLTLVAPILIAAPVYFSGDMTFGGLMMAVGAFNQVHSSLRWFINNIGAIADWRATLLRVSSFRAALVEADNLHGAQERIEIAANADDVMSFDSLEVVSPGGVTRLEGAKTSVAPGDRLLITGDPGAGKTLLFRTLAGLWPWGRGKIGMPDGESISFVAANPYFAPGTLREVLAYPRAAKDAPDAELVAALELAGLSNLAGSLDRDARWDRELNEQDQRMLAFARLAVQKPEWVVLDEALDLLEPDVRQRAYKLMESQLKGSAIINLGRVLPKDSFFKRQAHLVKDAAASALPKRDFTPIARSRRKLAAI